MKTKARHGKKGRRVFEIFTTSPSGSARHIESVAGLAVARKHLKQLALSATGDCFIYSEFGGIVELMVHSDRKKPLPPMHCSHIIRGRLAS
jgi:hypothetical protein